MKSSSEPRMPASRLRRLGPGLITGASDDDPSGIATYSQVGAQFGYGLAWTMLLSLPFMIAIQEISGRIGCVTGHGIASNLRRNYASWIVRSVVLLLLIANTINIGADLGAMGAALNLLLGGSMHFYTIAFGVVCVAAEIYITYKRYASVLKWLTLSLFAYVAVVFGACAVEARAAGDVRSAYQVERGQRDGVGCGAGDDDQSLPFLLAVCAGSGGAQAWR